LCKRKDEFNNEKLKIEKLKKEEGKWKMENGKWKVEN